MLWVVLPVHDVLVAMSGTFMPVLPTTSDEFEHKLIQLATILGSIKSTMTGPINKFI